MKILRYISTLCLALVVLTACDSDLEKVYYDDSAVTPSVLSGIGDTYVLNANTADATVIEFKWTKPDVGYSAKVINTLEMDLKGKNFAKAVALHSSADAGPYAISAKNLNDKIAALFKSYEMEVTAEPYDFEFRITSSISDAIEPFYSNVESSRITLFVGEPEYPKVYLPGGYCSWADPDNSFKQCQVLYSPTDNGVYEGWIVFGGKAAEGWKITPEASWDTSWGYDGGTTVMNPETITLNGGGNIACYDKFSYKFSFNKETRELSMLAMVNSWGVCGTHNSWGGTPDTPMTLAYDTDSSGSRAYYLTATVDFSAGDEWKIRADQDWGNQFAADAVDGDFEVGDNGNFKVSEAGTYTIKLYFNKVTAKVVVTKKA